MQVYRICCDPPDAGGPAHQQSDGMGGPAAGPGGEPAFPVRLPGKVLLGAATTGAALPVCRFPGNSPNQASEAKRQFQV